MDATAIYSAFASRDPRFDGVFFVGVTSTGIYCRPVCPARTPSAKNCVFFTSAAAAEKASFRPCLRCRPELAPGYAPVDNTHRIARLVADRIEQSVPGKSASMENIAAEFGWSSRQIRRIVQQELGVSPIELLSTRRLLLAKQLLTETSLPIIEVAYASGFASLRRFNEAFRLRYGMPPSRFRKVAEDPSRSIATTESFSLRLSYRPPFDWPGLLRFLHARTLSGVERIEPEAYLRTVRIGHHAGWIRVTNTSRTNVLTVELPHALTPVLPSLLGRLRNLFDLSARPDVIVAQLSQSPALRHEVKNNPGLRVPGAFDGFELAVRAILGQQITVKAATTLAARFVEAFGDPIASPYEHLHRLSPTPERIAAATIDDLAALGIVRSRALAIISLAQEIVDGRLRLELCSNPERIVAQLMELPGVGAWTAQYIAMRALQWPDAFPKEDIAIRKRLGSVSAGQAEVLSQAWRPWRSYATLHLWQSPLPLPLP